MWRPSGQVKQRTMDETHRLETLVAIMDRLRSPDGCPWDLEQSFETLRRYLLEECYEAADAIDRQDPDGLREELGDLLFQIVFLSRLAKEQGRFSMDDVIRGIAEKMIRRHPHIFSDARAETADDVARNWEVIKQAEKAGKDRKDASPLDGIPASLPAIQRSQQLGERAARVGFDWETPGQVMDKAEEEWGELRAAVTEGRPERVAEEAGDLIFALVMLCRHVGIDPEGALSATNSKFVRRFEGVRRRLSDAGVSLEEAGLERMERAWSEVKQEEQD